MKFLTVLNLLLVLKFVFGAHLTSKDLKSNSIVPEQQNGNLSPEVQLSELAEELQPTKAEILNENLKVDSLIRQEVSVGATNNATVATNTLLEETVLHYTPQCSSVSTCVNDELFEVMCDPLKSNGQWLVIQRRMDGNTNFYRTWREYKAGFGSMTGEFWIGLENLHILTTCVFQELLIEMEDFDNEKRYARYLFFVIAGERDQYALQTLGLYSGTAGDSMNYHAKMNFSTFDQDNDLAQTNCAQDSKGAWWYNDCSTSNLNGEYGNNRLGQGVNWQRFRGLDYSLKFVEMKIRPVT